jgi:ubiquinone/menaquinone biosynthesis C-methylase UbiE
MSFTDRERKTIEFYDKKGRDWAGSHDTVRYWGEWFERFKTLLPGGSVLELGTGAGRDAAVLQELGFDYTGVDISTGLLHLAKENNPNLPVSQQSLYELAFADNTFDGFWASAVLLHLPKDRVVEALTEAKRVTRPGGIGFISVKQGNGEKVLDDGRLFADYQPGELDQKLQEADLAVVESAVWPKSDNTTWLIYLVQT